MPAVLLLRMSRALHSILIVISSAISRTGCHSPNCIPICILRLYIDTYNLLQLPAMMIIGSQV